MKQTPTGTIADIFTFQRKQTPRALYVVVYAFGHVPKVFATRREALAARRAFRKEAWDVDVWIHRYDLEQS